MTLTSEQAIAMNARPRMTEAEVEQMISLRADGRSVAEIHMQFPQYAQGTIANKLTARKDQVDDLRRARTVQLSDVPGARLAARANDYWELRTTARMLYRKHLESCYATNPVTGEREFVEQLVDARKLKVYQDMVIKANYRLDVLTGQIPQSAPGLPANAAHSNLVGSSDLHLVDQGGDWTPRTVTYGRKLSQAERDARAQPVLDYWQAITDELRCRLADLREGHDPGPQSEMLEAAWAVSVEERAEWAADNAMAMERIVGGAEDEFANPEPESEPEQVTAPPVSVGDVTPDVPLEPPPGFSAQDGVWVAEWVDD